MPHQQRVGATQRQTASRSSHQVLWFPSLDVAWAGRGVLARLCVCCLDSCLKVCVSLSQLWGPTSGAAHRTISSCMSCWAWAALCSAWCMRCWDRSTRSYGWISSSSSTISSHRRWWVTGNLTGGQMNLCFYTAKSGGMKSGGLIT